MSVKIETNNGYQFFYLDHIASRIGQKEALQKGMRQKAIDFVKKGSAVYQKV